jgi:hypothetical protein
MVNRLPHPGLAHISRDLSIVCVAVLVACAPPHAGHSADASGDEDRDAGDGGASSDGGSADGEGSAATQVPLHRPTAPTCNEVRPSTVPDGGFHNDAGQCDTDSDCDDADAGVDGRCLIPGPFKPPVCSYDECFQDSDCGPYHVCVCRDYDTVEANDCEPSNCETDSDCGDGGYCSPMFGGCAPVIGIVGYYCHTPNDHCLTNSDCSSTGEYCVYDLALGNRWICAPLDCAG